MRRAAVAAALGLAIAGCGSGGNTDARAFTQTARSPTGRAILRSIATYRLTTDEARACSLVTPHFIRKRFGGRLRNCEQVLREASRHLPDSARVRSVAGHTARVYVDEPTATTSIYVMRRAGGTWRIDDIVEPR